ncbi:u6 snRNA-associated Sm-like protein, putative [Bodo saltans]|uniref:U6 snRNA-associated Sm-like protein, putative n=1 Tax=Bodo saltans TaxID=75058 RepID=A0A0S4KJY7_BODSA|nr:u6 snRNA-associated Sm-like protein, putative [Bodo saltans]|eukprot:CUI14778.1 u6 snRNA-associated Sm-like protein, putative [Bodo saltans]
MMMNIVLRNAIRCGTSGEVFWSAKEALVRGTSIVSMRLDPEALNTPAFLLRGRGRGAASGGRGGRGGRGGNATASTGDDADSRRGRGAGRGRGRGGDRGRGGRGGSGRGNGRGRGGATKRPRES